MWSLPTLAVTASVRSMYIPSSACVCCEPNSNASFALQGVELLREVASVDTAVYERQQKEDAAGTGGVRNVAAFVAELAEQCAEHTCLLEEADCIMSLLSFALKLTNVL